VAAAEAAASDSESESEFDRDSVPGRRPRVPGRAWAVGPGTVTSRAPAGRGLGSPVPPATHVTQT
jgi:hypothetical protein